MAHAIAIMASEIFVALGSMGVLCGLFMLARNSWVYRARMSVLHDPSMTLGQCLAKYERLPSYDAMMRRFWVWEVNDFLSADHAKWLAERVAK